MIYPQRTRSMIVLAVLACSVLAHGEALTDEAEPLRAMLDSPLLFVKRHSYQGIHIYDTYYKWLPGGGIYVIENPWDPPEAHRVRAVIDPSTPETLGEGIYSEPDVSWDAKRILFCFKAAQDGNTGIYEIGVDGTGLRRLSDPCECSAPEGRFTSQHDVCPAYLPDGRIVFKTTRPNGLVPCNNTGVDILHVMNADGTDIRRISVNNVNEFDPCVMPDGRILHGRWEYVDKTALTQQSLWTIFPDGTFETALFANNLVRPEAFLDARPVPGAAHLVVATLARHNAPPRGSIGIVNTRVSKNAPEAILNLEHPEDPTIDTGNSCEPWPLGEDVVLFSGRPEGQKYNVLELMDRSGRRETLHAEPDICCHAPIPLKPRALPSRIPEGVEPTEAWGGFYVQNVNEGLPGIRPGEVKWLRVLEETSRTSGSPGGGSKYNQTFLISAALAFSAKNYLGLVPVEPDGSAHFEAPAGRALYLQALDEDMRLVRGMRTFIQAAPGATRSCIGCHEHKFDAPKNLGIKTAHKREPVWPRPESWGTGFLDYPSMVQPVLDKHCVSCHGGEQGFAGRLDLSGGWTEHFSISYENLVSRREDQMTATLIAGIDCMNGTAMWSARLFGPRQHGSGAAPLAEVLVSGHRGRIPRLTRPERDLLMAWIDSNGVYYGTWDYTEHSPQLAAWTATRDALIGEMKAAGCMECHEDEGHVQFESDWFNLERPELSRILRAPLAKGGAGMGLSLCRAEKTEPRHRRIRLLVGGGYAHAVQPLESYRRQGKQPERKQVSAEPMATFASTDDPHYKAMRAIIRRGRRDVLSTPRVDMPGAEIIAGHDRQFLPPALPEPLPPLNASLSDDGLVSLSWERSARTIGLVGELYRSASAGFAPGPDTLLAETRGFHHLDKTALEGNTEYALVLVSEGRRSEPIRVSVDVPPATAPPGPAKLVAEPGFGRVALRWNEESNTPLRYNVYRSPAREERFERLTETPTPHLWYDDVTASPGERYAYAVRTVSSRGIESDMPRPVVAMAPESIREPVFRASFAESTTALCFGGHTADGEASGKAAASEGGLDLTRGGHVAYGHRREFDLVGAFSIECTVRLESEDGMPVIASCGQWNGGGWFLQRIGGGWRWYVGGVICDGGRSTKGEWTHLAATFDGRTARLYQDGRLVGEKADAASTQPWTGPLLVGQYSAGPGKPYQVRGWIRDLRLYQRILTEDDFGQNEEPGDPIKPA